MAIPSRPPAPSDHPGAVAIAFGGSILAPPEPDPTAVVAVATAIAQVAQERPVLVSVGGGSPARQAIHVARAAGASEEACDRAGIAATRLNAQVLLSVLQAQGVACNDTAPSTVAEAVALLEHAPVVVMGGTTPGHSTDFVAAELAVASGARRLVIATNVDGVYDRDPRRHPDARRIAELDFRRLLEIVGDTAWKQAGAAGVVDGPASLLVARRGLETCVVQGRDVENLLAACSGRPFAGSRIQGAKVPA